MYSASLWEIEFFPRSISSIRCKDAHRKDILLGASRALNASSSAIYYSNKKPLIVLPVNQIREKKEMK